MRKKIVLFSSLAIVSIGIFAFTTKTPPNNDEEGILIRSNVLHEGRIMPLANYHSSPEFREFMRAGGGSLGWSGTDCWAGNPATKGTICERAYQGTCVSTGCGGKKSV